MNSLIGFVALSMIDCTWLFHLLKAVFTFLVKELAGKQLNNLF